jgi:hypothetical protein
MLDVAQAVNALPALPAVRGTVGRIAPGIAPTPRNPGQSEGIPGNDPADVELSRAAEEIVGSALRINGKGPLTVPVNEPLRVGATGLEPVTPSVSW